MSSSVYPAVTSAQPAIEHVRYTTSRDAKFRAINPVFTRVLGWSEDDALGIPAPTLMARGRNLLEDAPEMITACRNAIGHPWETYAFTEWSYRMDGGKVWLCMEVYWDPHLELLVFSGHATEAPEVHAEEPVEEPAPTATASMTPDELLLEAQMSKGSPRRVWMVLNSKRDTAAELHDLDERLHAWQRRSVQRGLPNFPRAGVSAVFSTEWDKPRLWPDPGPLKAKLDEIFAASDQVPKVKDVRAELGIDHDATFKNTLGYHGLMSKSDRLKPAIARLYADHTKRMSDQISDSC